LPLQASSLPLVPARRLPTTRHYFGFGTAIIVLANGRTSAYL
jgi:hypothetical protein